MIHLRCEHCGQAIRVPRTHAGKTGRCPKCKHPVAVPTAPVLEPTEEQGPAETPACDVTLRDSIAPPEREPEEATNRYQEELDRRAAEAEAQVAAAPRHPWPLSAIVYTLHIDGLIHVLALCFILFVFGPLVMQRLGLGTEFIPLVYAMPVAYTVYYLAECVRDSSGGGRHPPAYWLRPGEASKWDCLGQLFLTVGTIAVYFCPASVYYILCERADWIFWLFLINGGFLFPMALLAALWFDSCSGLNPIVVVTSIARTLVPYCGLVLALFGIGWLFFAMGFRCTWVQFLPVSVLAIRVVQLHLVLIDAALLGRFYYRYKTRIAWED